MEDKILNDVHSRLNPTPVKEVLRPQNAEELMKIVKNRSGPISIVGGRHAMGGQQFCRGNTAIDMTALCRPLHLNFENGTAEFEAGAQWPDIFEILNTAQACRPKRWTVAQKQTGADRLSLGGALSANIHGRGLSLKPIIAQVISFTLIDANGDLRRCSRVENEELFQLAIGGYGLFGIITSVKLKLTPRRKFVRHVEITESADLISKFENRIREGFAYGDFQFSCNENSTEFLNRGVLSCYKEVPLDTALNANTKRLAPKDWQELLFLAHTDKQKAFERYAGYYQTTEGQIYWQDELQTSTYLNNYHQEIDRRLSTVCPASEMITELYVPRDRLADFLEEARRDFREKEVNVIYGTIRLIERDQESYLAWAKQNYACVIFNLHTEHSDKGLAHSAAAFKRLIDMAIKRRGSFYLTYHRFATVDQVHACYPQFESFLKLKAKYDPKLIFQSDWYRHYAKLFSERAPQKVAA